VVALKTNGVARARINNESPRCNNYRSLPEQVAKPDAADNLRQQTVLGYSVRHEERCRNPEEGRAQARRQPQKYIETVVTTYCGFHEDGEPRMESHERCTRTPSRQAMESRTSKTSKQGCTIVTGPPRNAETAPLHTKQTPDLAAWHQRVQRLAWAR
jgi:hypothetical protein